MFDLVHRFLDRFLINRTEEQKKEILALPMKGLDDSFKSKGYDDNTAINDEVYRKLMIAAIIYLVCDKLNEE